MGLQLAEATEASDRAISDAGLEQKLGEFLRSEEDWERSRPSVPLVFVVKLLGAGQGSGAHAGDKIPSTARASPGRGEGTWSGRIRGYSPTRGWSG